MRLLYALRESRGLRLALAAVAALRPVAALGAQGAETSHTVRNAMGSVLQTALEVAVPVVIVVGLVMLFRGRRRR
jgi:hypothetical protein